MHAGVRRAVGVVVSATVVAALGVVAPATAQAAGCPSVSLTGVVTPAPTGAATDWSGCDLYGADLSSSNLAGATLDRADLRFASLSGAALQGASLRGATLVSSSLALADLTNADATGSDLAFASLSSANLTSTVLDDAVLRGAYLGGATITGASFAGASLSRLQSSGLVGAPAALPTGWELRSVGLVGPGVDLTRRIIDDVDLSGLDLTGADLSSTYIRSALLTDTNLTDVDLRGTDLSQSTLTGATGLGTTTTNSLTDWTYATCPDGQPAEKHIALSCLTALDTVAPTVSLGAPASPFTWTNGFLAPVTVVETGSTAGEYRTRTLTMQSGGSRWNPMATSDWTWSLDGPLWSFTSPGTRTCTSVQVRDRAGNVSNWSAWRCADELYDSTAGGMSAGFGWTFRSDSRAFEWSTETATRTGSTIESYAALRVRQVGVLATTCPTCGAVAVYVGRTKVGSISLARGTSAVRRLLLLPRRTTAISGVVKVVVVSSGRMVRVDGVAVTGA